jgi:hypothetical protein
MKRKRTENEKQTNETNEKRYEISVNLNDPGSVYLIQQYVIQDLYTWYNNMWSRICILDTTICDPGSVYLIQHYVIEFVSDLRHVSGILQVSSTNKTDHNDKTEILLKVTLNILIPK